MWEKTVVACFKLDFGSCLDEVSKITRNLIKCSRSPPRYETGISSMRVGSPDRFSLDPVCRHHSFGPVSWLRFGAVGLQLLKVKVRLIENLGMMYQQETRRYGHVAVSQVQCDGDGMYHSSLTGLLVISKRTNRFLSTLAADYSMSVTPNSVHDDSPSLG